jgi:Zn-dependent protease with chaperone function
MEYRSDKEGAELTTPEDMAGGLKALDKWSHDFRIAQYKAHRGPDADPADASWLERALSGFRRAKDPHPSMKNRLWALEQQAKEAEKPAEIQIQR